MINLNQAELSVKMNLRKNPESFLNLSGCCEIILRETWDDNETVIGSIDFTLYHLVKFSGNYEDLINESNDESEDKFKLISDFFHYLNINDSLPCFSFITIDTMKIYNDYRNKQFGMKALKELFEFGQYFKIDYFVLQPAPIESLETDVQRVDLIRQIAGFYEKVGFRCYQKDGDEEPIMIYHEGIGNQPSELFLKANEIVCRIDAIESHIHKVDLSLLKIDPYSLTYYKQIHPNIFRVEVPVLQELLPPIHYERYSNYQS